MKKNIFKILSFSHKIIISTSFKIVYKDIFIGNTTEKKYFYFIYTVKIS